LTTSRCGFFHRRRHEGAAARRQAFGQAQGDRLGLGARDIADDGNHGTLRTIVPAVEGDEVLARDGAHALHRRADAVGMAGVDGRGETLAGNRVGPRFGLADAGNRAALFALQHRLRKSRRRQHGAHQVQRAFAFGLARQRAQADAGAVAVGPAAQAGAEVDQASGYLLLVHVPRTRFEQAAGQAGQARLRGRNEGAAGGKIDLHVQDGNYPRLDEIYLGSGGRHPVLDLDAGQGRGRYQGRQQTYRNRAKRADYPQRRASYAGRPAAQGLHQ
jgi:hypothetical protein